MTASAIPIATPPAAELDGLRAVVSAELPAYLEDLAELVNVDCGSHPVTEKTARRRVAITGIGLVTPVGNDVQATWSALDGVKNGAATITLFDASGFPTRIAAEVKGFDERVITAYLGDRYRGRA